MRPRRSGNGLVATVIVVGLTLGLLAPAIPAAGAGQRLDLVVLVLDDGGPQVDAIISELELRGVPRTIVDLADPGRPVIDAAFLAGETDGVPHGHFQAVVLASNELVVEGRISQAELDALTDYEATFGVRRVYARVWAGPGVGLEWTQYAGPLDGEVATVTAAGLGGPFGYLAGPVPIDAFTFGYLSPPLDPPPEGSSFDALVEVPVPGQGRVLPLIGIHVVDGREELVVAMGANRHQTHLRALAPGVVDWMTRGVHLGYSRNYFSVHVDDVFMPDDRWSTAGNCTPGDDCPTTPGGDEIFHTAPIRMTPADVAAVREWQRSRDFVLDLAFNGAGSDEAFLLGHDPLSEALLAARHHFRWINHTYEHRYLGCVQDFDVAPWVCEVGPTGVEYASESEITSEITVNTRWASRRRIPFRTTELVTGEHSGLRSSPQMPVDNPNLAPALAASGITIVASDASREPQQRSIGSALTVPRHPMNIFYNVATRAEEVDEYNWIYTAAADGGSGICEIDPNSTCIDPLDPTTGFETYIVPVEATIALGHILGNDPRPHYAHQSNLAEERILLPVIDEILARYRDLFAPTAPLLSPTMTESAELLRRRAGWEQSQGTVSAYVQDGVVVVTAASPTAVPLTVPAGTRHDGADFGSPYAGRRSAWTIVTGTASFELGATA